MKTILLSSLLFTLTASAQITIEKSDGTKIVASEVRFNAESEKLAYKIESKKKKIKYSQLREVKSDKFTFRYFGTGKKHQGYFVKAITSDKILAFNSYSPSYGTTTGFAGIPKVYLAIFDKSGNLAEEFQIRSDMSESAIQHRAEIIQKIKEQFRDCPKFIAELTSYLNAGPDQNNSRVFQYFVSDSKFVECE